MRKTFLFMALAACAFVACNKENGTGTPDDGKKEDEKQEEIVETKAVPFELVASINAAEGVNAGFENGDKIFAVTTDGEWKASDAVFTLSNGKFTTSTKIENGKHTFNLLYADASQQAAHTPSATEVVIPAEQTGIKGIFAAAAQVEETTPVEKAVDVAFSPLFSLVKVTVKNGSKAEATITSVAVEVAGAEIVGTYTVDFSETCTAALKENAGSRVTVATGDAVLADGASVDVYAVIAPLSEYTGSVKVTATDAAGASVSSTIKVEEPMELPAGSVLSAEVSLKPAPGPNKVNCGDFGEGAATAWTIKNINGDASETMKIVDGHLEVSRPGACDNNYRWVCYNKLSEPLVAGKWYKMSVKISVPTPTTWYARGLDLGFCVFGKDPAGLNDYKANKDCIFFVDTDMEAARQEVGPLHGTDGYVNFPTVCTYCNPADLKTNGGLFQAVEGQEWVGFYLRLRNTLVDLQPVLFDDVTIQEVAAPEE